MKKDISIRWYKLFIILFFAIYMWGPAWDQRFREVSYLTLFILLGTAVSTDIYQWWNLRKERLEELEELQHLD